MTETVIKKHKQAIIAIDNSYFELHNAQKTVRLASDFKLGLTDFPFETFCKEVASNIVIRERHILEEEPSFRQIIPYMTFTVMGDDGVLRYLPYARTNAAGEAKLHGKVSIGFGGHIDAKDVVYNKKSVIDLVETIKQAAIREKNEELTAVFTADLERFLAISVEPASQFIRLDATPVDAVHIGVVMQAILPNDLAVRANDAELVLLSPMTGAELLASGHDLENWTRIILETEACALKQAA